MCSVIRRSESSMISSDMRLFDGSAPEGGYAGAGNRPEPALAALAEAVFMASAVEILAAIRSIILRAAIWMTS